MQLTEQQLQEVRVFSEHEVAKIVQEFQYYNQRKEGESTNADDPFLE